MLGDLPHLQANASTQSMLSRSGQAMVFVGEGFSIYKEFPGLQSHRESESICVYLVEP